MSHLQPFLNRLLKRSKLSFEEQEAILNLKGHATQARAHIDIVSPGELTTHSCLVLDGMVGKFGQLLDGRRQITAFHVAGDMCDLHSVMVAKVGWSMQALTTTTMLKISHQDLLGLARTYPAIGEAFWRGCVVDASILSQWVVNVGRRDAHMRLAHLLCEMGVRLEQAGLGTRTRFELHVTQSQLADALGLTPVHLNRVMQTLRQEGLIATQHREIQIACWDHLARVGDFDEGYLETVADDIRPGAR